MKAKIVPGVTRKDANGNWKTEPTKLVRVHKPRNGGGVTLGEFTNQDGCGYHAALAYAEEKGHEVVVEK